MDISIPSVQPPSPRNDSVEEITTTDQFWDQLYCNPKDFKQQHLGSGVQPSDDFEWYMDKISNKIHKSSGLPLERRILFYDMSTTTPLDHPTGTKSKPDFAAYPSIENEFHWAEIEATIGISSAGMSETEGLHQAISHTLLLLQARPDRVSIQGMYVDDRGVILIISSPAGVTMSPKLHLTNTSHVRLIHAFIQRLYNPHPSMIDPTINRRKAGLQWVFDIRLPNLPSHVECCGYRIMNASGSLGQRTHIFVNKENPAHFNNLPIPIIKDQYSWTMDEAEVMRHIQAEGGVPGVVHLVHAGVVRHDDGSAGNGEKARICLSEHGTPFLDIKTPLEVLKAIYDLLEVTRSLYLNYQVLHRDISIGNVLYLERDSTAAAPPLLDTNATSGTSSHKFCSINHLLNLRGYNSTSTLLIDFNQGEIVKNDMGHSEPAGTPLFMARAVRAGEPQNGGIAIYSNVPELLPTAHAAYERVLPDRLTRFQHSSRSHSVNFSSDNKPWRHELRHDAESAFWLLVWWVVTALPEDASPLNKISAGIWYSLIDVQCDSRPYYFPPAVLHQTYSPLANLLNQLGSALYYDLHWATEEPYINPDFLHEVFQRHILNFIFANQDKEFMNKLKSHALRCPEEGFLI